MNVIEMRSKEANERLGKALQELDEFLASLPPERREMALQFQEEIRMTLSRAGSQHNRLVMLGEMMRAHLLRLSQALTDVSKGLNALASAANDAEKPKV